MNTTPEARKLRADALRLARAEGYHYDKRSACHRFSHGRFECEPFEIAYFYDLTMNGDTGEILAHPGAEEIDGEIFELSETERQAFDVDKSRTHYALFYSSQGFLSLQYLTAEETEALLADYASEAEE